MGLPKILRGHMCDARIREVFTENLIPRSEKLVEDVRDYVKELLTELCERACGKYPLLLNEVKTRLLDEFVNDMERKTKEAVLNVCYPELDWAFTQNASYQATLKEVDEEVQRRAASLRSATTAPVCGVPAEFFQWFCYPLTTKTERVALNLQVGQIQDAHVMRGQGT